MSDGAPIGPDGDGITPTYLPRQQEQLAPCQSSCPNCGDIRAWIGTVAQRERLGLSRQEAYARAWRIIADVNPFPSTLGRVCPHPCEAGCNRAQSDGALSINAMERFLGDWAVEQGLPLARLDSEPKDPWIGVVGAGPSGLSFAYQMARRGYRVTVYESREKPGGMLRYGIPDYRLPPAVLDGEIQKILDLGVELELGVAMGRDVTLPELRERHEAVYLAIGAQEGRSLGIPGEDGSGVWVGTDLLERVNCGETIDLGRRVAVIGGGNTAVDAARTARRAGAEVTVLYRRSRQEMPAADHEVEEALAEGVTMEFLVAPVEIIRRHGAPRTLVCRRMELGEPDESGRRRPVPVDGSDFEVDVDAVIAAVSQQPRWEGAEGLELDGSWLSAGDGGAVVEGVWAGGDVLGLGIAGDAIVQGRRAAEALHARLGGTEPPPAEARPLVGPESIRFDYHPGSSRADAAHIAPAEAVANPDTEVSLGISEEEFLAEVDRCLSCGSCFGCQQCWMYCTAGCFTRVEEPSPGVYFTLSLDQCESCGKCVELCPCGYLTVQE